jgi:hypothetical protein
LNEETRQNVNEETRQNVNEETRQNVNEETRQNVNKEIPQCRLIEGVAKEGGRQEVLRYSQEPYTFRYSHPTDTITGIACVPLSAEIQSPEAEVIEGDIVYKQEVLRYSQEPYTFRYSHPTGTITGIACVPLSAEIQSPQVDVVEGGIDCNFVTIRLTPVERGKWACKIAICVKPSAARPAIEVRVRQILGLSHV